MKALFRLIVLCFFLFRFGLAFASQSVEIGGNYVLSGSTFIPGQVCKKEACKVYCQTEVEVEVIHSMDNTDHSTDKVDLSDVLHFLTTYVFNLDLTTPILGEQKIFAYLQQHRAKYLLYQSLKIPHGLVKLRISSS
ncbi:hypothetical protein [Myroides sp. N17-2]|uniref:hypothetical protein n=1 Tax=Myroides sp. N17-2 TaxID=2030799 RepID=UPI000EFA8C67|nr:hypothetical protein [Myroides sp. N17-2]